MHTHSSFTPHTHICAYLPWQTSQPLPWTSTKEKVYWTGTCNQIYTTSCQHYCTLTLHKSLCRTVEYKLSKCLWASLACCSSVFLTSYTSLFCYLAIILFGSESCFVQVEKPADVPEDDAPNEVRALIIYSYMYVTYYYGEIGYVIPFYTSADWLIT